MKWCHHFCFKSEVSIFRLCTDPRIILMCLGTSSLWFGTPLSRAQSRDTALPAPVQEGIRVSLDVGGPYADLHLARPAYLDSVRLLVDNPGNHVLEGRLYLGIRKTPFEEVQLEPFWQGRIPAGACARIALRQAVLGSDRGMRYVDWHFQSEHARGRGVIPFAMMEPVGPTPGIDRSGDGFVFGIAGGMRTYKDSGWKRTFFRAAGLIGCEAYRVDMSWNHLEPQKGQFRWAGLDEVVSLAQEQGMFIQPLMAYGNEWALTDSSRRLIAERNDQGHAWRYPVKLEHWSDFCQAVAARYRPDQMNYYEIWNEADINFWKGTAREYVDMLIASYETLKRVNPEIIVTTTGFTNLSHHTHRREIVTETFSRAKDHFDVLAWHRHGPFAGFADEIDNQLWPLRKQYGIDDKPIVFNETALGLRFEQEWDLAAAVVKKMSFSWARGAIGHYWYNLSQSHPLYVMMNDNWTPRPNYVAYNELARHLRGRRYSHELEVGPGRYAFAFRGRGTFSGTGDKDYCVVAWVQDPLQGDLALDFVTGTDLRSGAVYDLMGNTQALRADRGLCMARIQQEPRFFELTGCTAAPQVVRALRIPPTRSRLAD